VFNWCETPSRVPGFDIRETPTNIIDLSSPLDQIWKQLDKSSTRYAIKKAQREEIEIRSDSDYEEFLSRYREFARSKGISQVGRGEVGRSFGTLFTAWTRKKLIAGQYYICERPIFRLRLSASFQYRDFDHTFSGIASKLLHWIAIEKAQDEGYKQFDFGGLTLDPNSHFYGVSKFKLSFGGQITNRYSYIKDYSKILRAYRFAHRFLRTIGGHLPS